MNLQHASPVLRFILQLFSQSTLRVSKANSMFKSRFLQGYSCLILLVLIGIFINGIVNHDMKVDDVWHKSIEDYLDLALFCSIRLTHIVVVLETLLMGNVDVAVHSKLGEIDRAFERRLNYSVENGKFWKRVHWGCLASVVFYGCLLSLRCLAVFSFWPKNSHYLLQVFLPLWPEIAVMLRNFLAFVYIYNVQLRLDLLEKCARAQLPLWYERKLSYRSEIKINSAVVAMRDIHRELVNLTVVITKRLFGLSIFVCFFNDFLQIICHAYWSYFTIEFFWLCILEEDKISEIITFWAYFSYAVVHALQIFARCFICHRTMASERKLPRSVHNLITTNSHDFQIDLIKEVSLEFFHKKIKFTVYQLFAMNIPLILTISDLIVTYLIIVIQLHQADNIELLNIMHFFVEKDGEDRVNLLLEMMVHD